MVGSSILLRGGGRNRLIFRSVFAYLKLSRPKANCRESLCFFFLMAYVWVGKARAIEEKELSTNLQELVSPRKGDSYWKPPFLGAMLVPWRNHKHLFAPATLNPRNSDNDMKYH